MLDAAESLDSPRVASGETAPSQGRLRMLHIEDNTSDAMLLARMLRKGPLAKAMGITHVARMADALSLLDQTNFDLVLLDLTLHDIDGIAAVSALHAEIPKTPILVYSGNADETMRQQALVCGAREYLVKGQETSDSLQRAIGAHTSDSHPNTSQVSTMLPPTIVSEASSFPANGFNLNGKSEGRPLQILLAEDSAGDALLTQKAIQATGIAHEVCSLRKGSEILALLKQWHAAEQSLPDVLMLDLELPGTDGFEVLAEIARGPVAIRALPIIILTGHQNFEYLRKMYDLCIFAYMNKPCRPAELKEVLSRITYTLGDADPCKFPMAEV